MDLRNRFLEAMSRAATFVAVATTDGEAGRFGVTLSSFTSVSADGGNPSLLGCIHHLSPAATAILKNRAFAANLLAVDQQAIANRFAGRGAPAEHADRFTAVDWVTGPLGQPLFLGATATLECRLATAVLWETHYIIVGNVASVRLSENTAALLYGLREYRKAVNLGAGAPPTD